MPLKYNPSPDPEPPSTTSFWSVMLFFLLGAIAVGGYYIYRPAAPEPPAPPSLPPPKPVVKVRHLAPEGTFYVVDYISVHLKSGVIGFEPGSQVHLVKVLKEKQKLVVSDGSYEAEADPGQLTNDLDIAELARYRDSSSQAQLARFQSSEKASYEKSVEEQNVAHAKDVTEFNQKLSKGIVVGTSDNALNKGAEPTRSYVAPTGYYYGSPYSYFGGPYYHTTYP